MDYSFIDIKTVETAGKGSLSFFEGGRDIPFEVRRVYYTYAVPEGTWRGGHAHRDLRQMLWCPYGRIGVLLDDGRSKELVELDGPSKGLLVEKMVWHDMIWRDEKSVLVVVASDYYDETDYIRDYEVFKREVEALHEDSVY